MQASLIEEARRQIEICNACRYCEGYCSVFPAVHRARSFADGDLVQLANLCHNCRGCYYSCQYTEPHLFALNVPKVMAELRQDSWQQFAWPGGLAALFQRSGVALALALLIGIAALFWAMSSLRAQSDGSGFYAALSHNAMVAIFAPAFLLPLVSLAISLRRYWHHVGGRAVTLADLVSACSAAATMRNLSGGHGDGCNFEDGDRFSGARRWAHQATLYGFLLCFAATSVATIMHYVLSLPAPYGPFSPPKLLGVPGGLLLSFGTAALLALKLRSDKGLADSRAWGGEVGFILLLFLVSTTGLALYWFGSGLWLRPLLAIHLGSVLAFFLLTPFSKMAHGFYRMAALVREAQLQRSRV